MKRTDFTYPQLENVLRAFGFTFRPGRIHAHHLLAARMELEDFAIADPSTFEAKLQMAG